MIRPGDRTEAERLTRALLQIQDSDRPLLGIPDEDHIESLVGQIIESQRRNRFFAYLISADINPMTSANPNTKFFDPLRAAVVLNRQGRVDEAFWMVFLYTHFGKNRYSGYGYARDVYGRLEGNPLWTWEEVSGDVVSFRDWILEQQDVIRARNRPGGFGNHRKYESLDGWSHAGTGSVVESYVQWVGPLGHLNRIEHLLKGVPPQRHFDVLYEALNQVHRFGRTARFDYLMTASKLRLLDIKPTHAHLTDATGPAKAVKLISTGSTDSRMTRATMDEVAVRLRESLSIDFDVLEDALCNWQKSPDAFKPFRG